MLFGINLASATTKNYAGTAPSIGAIWDIFIEQHLHQSIKKALCLVPNQPYFYAYLMQI